MKKEKVKFDDPTEVMAQIVNMIRENVESMIANMEGEGKETADTGA